MRWGLAAGARIYRSAGGIRSADPLRGGFQPSATSSVRRPQPPRADRAQPRHHAGRLRPPRHRDQRAATPPRPLGRAQRPRGQPRSPMAHPDRTSPPSPVPTPPRPTQLRTAPARLLAAADHRRPAPAPRRPAGVDPPAPITPTPAKTRLSNQPSTTAPCLEPLRHPSPSCRQDHYRGLHLRRALRRSNDLRAIRALVGSV
jgi:hypothetical protein